MSNVVLCTDTVSAQYPECIGLEGEQLSSQSWLNVLSDAQVARLEIREQAPQEIWVAGSNDISAINLAAALKQDGVTGKVCLVAPDSSGSLLSRAQAANIDEVWDQAAFIARYSQVKHSFMDNSTSEQPTESLQIKPDVTSITDKGFLLSIVGAGGGVGKSSIAVIAAYLAQSKGYKTVLVDADLQFGDIAYLTGREDVLALDEALETPARLEAMDCAGRLPAIVGAPTRLEYSETVAEAVPQCIEVLRSRFDVVVVNTSPAWSDIHLQLLEAGGAALFVLDQRPSSIRSCKHALQLCARCGVATQPIVFALNRCSRQSLFSSIDVTCALQGAHVVELSEGGRDVEELLGTGAPLELLDSGNALCQSLARVLADLLPKHATEEAPIIAMPSKRRFRIGLRRKKAACL